MGYNQLIGCYGWVAVAYIHDSHFLPFIHPGDVTLIKEKSIQDNVFKCVDIIAGDYLMLQSTEITIRLKKQVFTVMPVQPNFVPLEEVKCISSKGKLEFGVIVAIIWHRKEERLIYELKVNGKIKGRSYYDEDLMKVCM